MCGAIIYYTIFSVATCICWQIFTLSTRNICYLCKLIFNTFTPQNDTYPRAATHTSALVPQQCDRWARICAVVVCCRRTLVRIADKLWFIAIVYWHIGARCLTWTDAAAWKLISKNKKVNIKILRKEYIYACVCVCVNMLFKYIYEIVASKNIFDIILITY